MNGQEEDAMVTATVPATETDSERIQRTCAACGNAYSASPRWRQSICPTCNGQRAARGRAQRNEPAAKRKASPPGARPNAFFHADGAPSMMPTGDPIKYELTANIADAAPAPTELGRELAVMQGLGTLLDSLDDAARPRVMAWLTARYRESTSW